MIEEKTDETMNLEPLREAVERRDPDALIGFYADDAELRVLNAASPDSPGFELRGRAEIERYLRVVLDYKTSSHVEDEVAGEQRVEFSEVCEYPDGTRIVVRTALELGEGGILRQLDVVERSSKPRQRK
ncbi:MAG: nuclear transport factor 2 family protein [Rubrobacteraceae bacterium]|jgi:hypothetical protein|nr:nuclear transport factor 2 family protein [Rubrobacter sp.]